MNPRLDADLSPRQGYLFIAGLYLLLILPRVVTLGFFADGMLYAVIALNMAKGIGGFWSPEYIPFVKEFFEHPPLSFWVHSFFYRIFGDLPILDGLYGLFLGAGVLYTMAAIYRRHLPRQSSWGPMLLLLSMPMFTWAFGNNMLENLMSFMAIIAVYLQYIAGEKQSRSIIFHFLSGTALALGILAKNPAVIFPLALPFFRWVILKEGSFERFFLNTAAILAGLVITFSALVFGTGGEFFIKKYIENQLIGSISGQRGGEALWLMPVQLIMETTTAAGIAGIIWLFFRKKAAPRISKDGLFFLAIGLSATLPLLLVPKQRTYYILPGLPFLAMALASFFEPVFKQLELWYKEKVETPLRAKKEFLAQAPPALLLIIALVSGALLFNKPGRIKNFFHDLYPLAQKIDEEPPPKGNVFLCPSLRKDYMLVSHIKRYLNLTPVLWRPWTNYPAAQGPYWALKKKNVKCNLPPEWKMISPGQPKQYEIFELRNRP